MKDRQSDPEGVAALRGHVRVFDQGGDVRVTISRTGVGYWADRWPCFGDERGLSAIFDRRSGDLLDLTGDKGMDESGVVALLADAQEIAAKRLKLDW